MAGINIGVIGKYDNKEEAANLNSKASHIKPKIVFKEGVYARKGLFMPGQEGFVRGRRLFFTGLIFAKTSLLRVSI